MNVTFTVIGKPQAKARPRITKKGYAYTPKKTLDFENLVKLSYLQQIGRSEMIKGPIELEVKFYWQIPKSYTKKKKESIIKGELLYTKKPDLDNCIKSIMDALNEIVYEDDKQIVKIIASKHYTTEKARTEIRITEIQKPVLE